MHMHDDNPVLAGYRRRGLMETSSLAVLQGKLAGLEARIERLEAGVAREPKPKTLAERAIAADVSDLEGKEGAFTVNEFCQRFKMSRSSFYNLLRSGDGPELLRSGGRPRISFEAARKWRERHEQAEGSEPEGDDATIP
jgi:hypothetical protein